MEATQPESDEALLQLVIELLPPAWRQGVRIERVMGALTVFFADEQGHRHAFDARPLDPDVRATVSGEHLAYSYKEIDPEVDALDLFDAYREALSAFAAREVDLLPWLSRAPVLGDECAPAPDKLRDALVAALPEAWRREVEAYTTIAGFVLRFRDAEGLLHGLDGRRLGPDVAAFVQGERLAYAYAILDARVDSARWSERYREALAGFVAREAEIVEALSEAIPFGPEVDPSAAPTSDREPSDGEYATLAVRTDCEAAPEALSALLGSLLPEAWRNDVKAYVTADGFVLRFRDAEGRAHGLDGRRLRPNLRALVRGEKLAFAYERHTTGEDLNPYFDAYTEALRAFLAREADIAALLPRIVEPAQPPSPRDHRPNETEAPESLTELLRDALPPAWRGEVAIFVVAGESILLRARDEAGVLHALDVRRLKRNQPYMIQGAALGYSYTKVDPRLDEASAVAVYREILARFVAREADIVAQVDAIGMA